MTIFDLMVGFSSYSLRILLVRIVFYVVVLFWSCLECALSVVGKVLTKKLYAGFLDCTRAWGSPNRF